MSPPKRQNITSPQKRQKKNKNLIKTQTVNTPENNQYGPKNTHPKRHRNVRRKPKNNKRTHLHNPTTKHHTTSHPILPRRTILPAKKRPLHRLRMHQLRTRTP